MEKIINQYIKTYLVGPMEKVAAGDSGTGWRNKIKPMLEALIDKNENPIYVFNPCASESNKTGYEPGPFHIKLRGWIASGNNDLVAEYTDLIWRGKHSIETDEKGEAHLISVLGDCDYVLNSDFLILRMEEHDSGCGTFGECFEAFKHHIPIYVIQTFSREKYPVTLTGWVFASGGRFFDNMTQLIEFLKTTYKLKEKK
jgi:hypothetical protein